MQGVAVTGAGTSAPPRGGRVLTLRIGDWPSGLYFARLTCRTGASASRRSSSARTPGRAPRRGRPADADVAGLQLPRRQRRRARRHLVRDWNVHTVRLARPFLEPRRALQLPPLRPPFPDWLARTGRGVDVLSDADLYARRERRALAARLRPDRLSRPPRVRHDARVRRRRGLPRPRRQPRFLSANNFFWRVKRGNVMEKTEQWRDLGRPEAALIGVQYRGNDRGGHRPRGRARTRRPRRGSSPAPACRTARSSRAAGSRSTRPPPPPRAARTCWPRSRTCSGPASPRR